MSQKVLSPFLSLMVGLLMVPTLCVFTQAQDAAAHFEESAPVEALQIILGRDSPNLGGNTFREAFIAMTLNDTLGVEVSRIVNEISFSSTAGIAFERASLTPDVEAAGATVEVEAGEAQGDVGGPTGPHTNNRPPPPPKKANTGVEGAQE